MYVTQKSTNIKYKTVEIIWMITWKLRSWSQKIAVVPRSGLRTIRDGICYKKSWGLSESVLRSFKRNYINNRIYEPSLIVHDPLRGTNAIFLAKTLLYFLIFFTVYVSVNTDYMYVQCSHICSAYCYCMTSICAPCLTTDPWLKAAQSPIIPYKCHQAWFWFLS